MDFRVELSMVPDIHGAWTVRPELPATHHGDLKGKPEFPVASA